ncbi:hypothetical protein [Maritimibacter sp. 55A14]|nr:hypothetical protein [Maritimibacter sp. 55A14]
MNDIATKPALSVPEPLNLIDNNWIPSRTGKVRPVVSRARP